MPRPARRPMLHRAEYTDAEVFQAATSIAFLGSFGTGPEAQARMREAWKDRTFRERVYSKCRLRARPGREPVPWIIRAGIVTDTD